MQQPLRTILSVGLILLLGFLGAGLFELVLHFSAVVAALDHSAGLAAWAQAAGGIAAVIAAFLVVSVQTTIQHRREDLRRRERNLAALAMMDASVTALQGLSITIPNVASLHNLINSGIPVGFGVERAARQLEKLPVWELGNPNAVSAVDLMLRIMLTAQMRANNLVTAPPPVDAADPIPGIAELQLDVQRAANAKEQMRVALGL